MYPDETSGRCRATAELDPHASRPITPGRLVSHAVFLCLLLPVSLRLGYGVVDLPK